MCIDGWDILRTLTFIMCAWSGVAGAVGGGLHSIDSSKTMIGIIIIMASGVLAHVRVL
jgi:hypothetical protein